jgi:type IV secretion system protein VirB8
MAQQSDDALIAYYQAGEMWETEILRHARRSRAVAWTVCLMFGVLALLALVALILLVPLKSFEPYIVEVDRNTGYLEVKSGLTKSGLISDQQAITQANVVRYIRAREGYDPFAISQNFGIAALLSAERAARDLQDLHNVTNPSNPAERYGKATSVTVEIKSVTFSNASTCLVRFSTTETSETTAITRHFISVVRYRYTETPATNAWRFENPLGFQVYDYRRDQESVSPEDDR